MSGIYLHIPFCNSKCIYCGFYSVVGEKYKKLFIPALKREISERRDFFAPSDKVKTLYVGGGTPSVLDFSVLCEAVGLVRENFDCALEEFTVEVNPDDVTVEYARALRALGVNRISMGVQSFSDEHLRWMRRRHNSDEVIESYKILRECGFDNISMDLIFGYEGLTGGEWMADLEQMIYLKPEHISAYQMSIDEGTPLEELVQKGRSRLLPDAECAEQYAVLQSFMKEGGYEQYEVSNFALPGRRSRHNSAYWERVPYLGLGPGAHSFSGNVREWNFPNVELYCNLTVKEIRGGETLTGRDVFNEALMLGLRRTEGVNLAGLDKKYVSQIPPAVGELIARGLLQDNGVVIKIPPEKLFLSDGIIRELFV